jgi:hypothetical protein
MDQARFRHGAWHRVDTLRLALALLFCLANALIFAHTSPGLHFTEDTQGYLTITREALGGGLHTLDLRLPGYGLFLIPFFTGEGLNLAALVATQCLLAVAAAYLGQWIYDDMAGKRGVAVFALSLFCIGTVSSCQTAMTESLYTFAFMAHCWALLRFLRTRRPADFALAALCAAVAALIKGLGVSVFAVSTLFCIARLAWDRDLRALRALTAGGLLAFALPIGLFLAYKHGQTGSMSLVPERYAVINAGEYVASLEGKLAGYPMPGIVELRLRGQEATRAELGISREQWDAMTQAEHDQLAYSNLMRIIWSYGPAKLARALAFSAYALFADDPGAVLPLLGLPDVKLYRAVEAFRATSGRELALAAACVLFKAAVYLYVLAKFAAYLFAAGRFSLGRKTLAGWFIALHVAAAFGIINFMGSSRFRVPLDPLLFAFVWHQLHDFWAGRACARRAPAETSRSLP